jgi:hypothetical protein
MKQKHEIKIKINEHEIHILRVIDNQQSIVEVRKNN